jgi:hypothetical protein
MDKWKVYYNPDWPPKGIKRFVYTDQPGYVIPEPNNLITTKEIDGVLQWVEIPPCPKGPNFGY